MLIVDVGIVIVWRKYQENFHDHFIFIVDLLIIHIKRLYNECLFDLN